MDPTQMRRDQLLFQLLEFYGTRINHPGKSSVHKRLRRLFKAKVDGDFEVIRQGLKWLLNPSDFVQTEFFWTGDFDHWDVFHVKQRLKPSSIIFDVGANFGYYSITLCKALGCKAYAFEPNPPTYQRLTKNLDLNALSDIVQAHCMGLSDRSGSRWILPWKNNSGAAAVQVGTPPQGEQTVLTTLDEFCGGHGVERSTLPPAVEHSM